MQTRPSLLVAAIAFATTALPACAQQATRFDPFEATIPQMRAALNSRSITCTQLVQYYLDRIQALDKSGPTLNSMRSINPRALEIAAQYDRVTTVAAQGPLFCIPVVVKDNINTLDMPTTAGSVALEGSFSVDDAFLVKRLKAAGAIILGKANLTEYANYLTGGMPAGYSSLGGYVLNAYDPRPDPALDGRPALSPGGSSAGPGVVAAANLASITVGTETSGSILSPSNQSSLAGIKPTVGLISREGVIPIAASQDTAGPMTRTVTDAAILLGAMTGIDAQDSATSDSIGKFTADYTPFLRADGLRGARIGVPREPYWTNLTVEQRAIAENSLRVMREQGAEVLDVTIASVTRLNAFSSTVLRYEFKRDLNAYLATLASSAPIKSLADVIAFNAARPDVALKYGQTLAIASQATDLDAERGKYLADRDTDIQLARNEGIDAVMAADNLSAIFFPGSSGAGIAAKAGYPSIIVPAGYLGNGAPYGIMLTARAFEEQKLIPLAYAFEQASKARRAPGTALRLLPVSATIQPLTVSNYASGQTGAIAPGEMVVIAGTGLGNIETTRALFDGVPAHIVSVRTDSIVAMVPYAVATKSAVNLVVEYAGQRSSALRLPVSETAPGIFPSLLNQDGSRNSVANPAAKGSIVTFFVTGEGRPRTLGIDGRPAAAPLAVPNEPVVVGVNSAGIEVLYAGAAPGLVGIMQINARTDINGPSGNVPLIVKVGGNFSQSVPLYIR